MTAYGLDAVLAAVNKLAADPRIAVQELAQQFALRGDARPWSRREGRVVFVAAHDVVAHDSDISAG